MSEERKYLLITDVSDDKDYTHERYMRANMISSEETIPYEYDNRIHDFPEILDQLWLGACTGYAAAAAGQYLSRMKSPISAYHYLNPLYVYRKTRELMGTSTFDSGASIRDTLKIMKENGACTISRYETDPSHFTYDPDKEADENAQGHRIEAYYRIMQASQLKQASSSGDLVVMGIEIYSSFESDEVAHSGIVPMPDRNKESFLGGHAIVAYGYKTINGVEYIICRNSWGPGWGDKGYFYLPMDFIGRYVTDMWVVK